MFHPLRADIARFCGPKALEPWVDAMARLAPELCKHYGFTRLDWCHFMGQIGAETNGMSLSKMEENMYFTTTARIVQVYSYRLGIAIRRVNAGQVAEPAIARGMSVSGLASRLRGQPTLLADIVYGGREGTPWMQGSRYIGRGPTQITHRNNYKAVGEEIAKQPGGEAFDLVGEPELLATDPELGIRAAFADWHLKGLSRYARQDSVDLVSDVLNTGNPHDNVKPHNLSGRKRWTASAKGIWPAASDIITAEPIVEDGKAYHPRVLAGLRQGDRDADGDTIVADLQRRLQAQGYPVGYVDGIFGTLTRRAVVALQSEHELVVDGIVGIRTWDVLETTAPAEMPEREAITADVLAARGSTQIKLWRRVRHFARWLYGLIFSTLIGEATGLDILDRAASSAGRIASFAERLDLPAGLSNPKVLLLLALTIMGLGAWLVSSWASQGIDDRVGKAKTGGDLSK